MLAVLAALPDPAAQEGFLRLGEGLAGAGRGHLEVVGAPDPVGELAGEDIAAHHRPVGQVKPQSCGPLALILSVAREAVRGENRPDVPVVVHRTVAPSGKRRGNQGEPSKRRKG